jgi:rod shape-determining protein MreC
VKARAGGTVIRYAAPLRALAQRFSFLLLILAATALMMIGKVDTVLVEGLRARITDAFAPILDVIARPAAGAANFLESASDVFYLRSENQRLRQENATLLQ